METFPLLEKLQRFERRQLVDIRRPDLIHQWVFHRGKERELDVAWLPFLASRRRLRPTTAIQMFGLELI